MQQIKRSALARLPAAVVFDLVDDVDNYTHFLPWCTKSQTLEAGENWKRAKITIQKGLMKVHFTSLNQQSPPHRIDLEQIEGPCRSLTGCWRFKPISDNATEIGLTIDFELKRKFRLLFNNTIMNRVADLVMDTFCAEAKRIEQNEQPQKD